MRALPLEAAAPAACVLQCRASVREHIVQAQGGVIDSVTQVGSPGSLTDYPQPRALADGSPRT